MRILQMSDLHLEFHDFRPTEPADILMLNGDICVAEYFAKSEASKYHYIGQRALDFFKYCSDNYEYVLYVPGNHEYYTGRFDKAINTLEKIMSSFGNIYLLNNSYKDIEGVRFIGSTLWTSVNNSNPINIEYLSRAMSDYKIIKYFDGFNYRTLSPSDTAHMHHDAKIFLDNASAGLDNVVIMTHHAPSFNSVHPKYHNDTQMNYGYYSDLDGFILDRPQIKLWTHGHMHDCFDYMIGNTRIVCNPKGYGSENKYFKPDQILEI